MVNEYTTPDYVQAELRTSNTFSSSTTPTLAQLTTWIQEESKIIELRTGTVFSSTLASSVYLDYDGDNIFRLPHAPILSVEELRYNQSGLGQTASWLTLEEGSDKNFITYLDEGEIQFVSGVNATNKVTPQAGNKKMLVSYYYGYDTTPLDIQRLATLAVSKRVVNSLLMSQSNTEGGTIQVGTISITDPSNFSVGWFRQVNDEMDNIYNSIGQGLKVHRITRLY